MVITAYTTLEPIVDLGAAAQGLHSGCEACLRPASAHVLVTKVKSLVQPTCACTAGGTTNGVAAAMHR